MKRGMQLGALALAAVVLSAGPARAADKEAINQAVERGVRDLQAQQQPDGTWPHEEIGLTSLCGLALLECGVPVDDPHVQKAAAVVRERAPTMGQTYSIALSILFLDRLGEPVDVALIESLTVRLLAGQTTYGGWSYNCPAISGDEQRRLTTLVKERAERGPPKELSRVKPGTRTVKDLPQQIQVQLEQVQRNGLVGPGEGQLPGDNSNTQFAILGLWVGRRYGLPVDGALGLAERRFRTSVRPDGGWDYMSAGPPRMPLMIGPMGGGSTPAMTCAGLLGIGLAYGAWNDVALRTEGKDKDPDKPAAKAIKPQDPSKDKVVIGAFRLLGAWVDALAQLDRPPRVNERSGKFYYFLWSLERVCVAYGVDKIGKTDWYDWGADVLLANQGPDGGWSNGLYPNGPDTCFALLFLKRANLAEDLSRALKSQMKEGGLQAALRQGGVGGAELIKGRKPFFGGPGSEDKQRTTTDADAQSARLAKQLAAAEGNDQERLLKELRDGKGVIYTDALAAAIPKLDGEARKKAREALAERMARMSTETLEVKLADDEAEVRRAAALAVAMKPDRAHTYRLIELLGDEEATVARAAYAALKDLTGQDFGPAKDAGREERAKAIRAWKDWWAKQQAKR